MKKEYHSNHVKSKKTKRRGEGRRASQRKMNELSFKNSADQQSDEKMKSFLREPLRPPRLCVEKNI